MMEKRSNPESNKGRALEPSERKKEIRLQLEASNSLATCTCYTYMSNKQSDKECLVK